ncbi:MAG: FecR family protein [bacterium]
MKIMTRQVFWFIFMILFFQTANSVSGFTPSGSIGKVLARSQPVVIIRDGTTLEISAFGSGVQDGDTIVTGEAGKAQIILSDGDQIFLAPWSKLTLEKKEQQDALVKTASTSFAFEGKIRAKVRKSQNRRLQFKSANAEISIKGTEFVAEYKKEVTTVATLEGLVGLSSIRTDAEIDIPPGSMSSVTAAGEVLPLSEIAGEILQGVESAGEKMSEEDISGKKN